MNRQCPFMALVSSASLYFCRRNQKVKITGRDLSEFPSLQNLSLSLQILVSYLWLMLRAWCEPPHSPIASCALLPVQGGKDSFPISLKILSWNIPHFIITIATVPSVIGMTHLLETSYRFWNLLRILPRWGGSCASHQSASLYKFQSLVVFT